MSWYSNQWLLKLDLFGKFGFNLRHVDFEYLHKLYNNSNIFIYFHSSRLLIITAKIFYSLKINLQKMNIDELSRICGRMPSHCIYKLIHKLKYYTSMCIHKWKIPQRIPFGLVTN